jgi:hypothetical protein
MVEMNIFTVRERCLMDGMNIFYTYSTVFKKALWLLRCLVSITGKDAT